MDNRDHLFNYILFGCGIFLAVTETVKQLLLFFMNSGVYDWWFFPFQLCSLPMYLCLALPWLPRRPQTICCTFMQDFNLLGGAAALIVSEGFPRGHWFLSLHAYGWHILLLFIGLFIAITGHSDNRWAGYTDTLPLFIGSCIIATIINVLAPGKQADMFYISPYHPNEQLLFHQLAQTMGIIPGHLLYLTAICIGAALLHLLFQKLHLETCVRHQTD